MKAKKEALFDLPMILSLVAVCFIMMFITYAENKHRPTEAEAVAQRDSVEVVVPANHNRSFSGATYVK